MELPNRMYLAMKLQDCALDVTDTRTGKTKVFKPDLPKGCVGALYVFKSVEAAKAFSGNDVATVLVEPSKMNNS